MRGSAPVLSPTLEAQTSSDLGETDAQTSQTSSVHSSLIGFCEVILLVHPPPPPTAFVDGRRGVSI